MIQVLTLALILLKLWIVADQEIVATDHPHDDLWYIQQAASWIWFRPYDNLAIAHLPVYSGFILLNSMLGMPLRFTSELIFIGAGWSLSSATARIGIPPLGRVLVFVLLVFHPQPLVLLSYTLSETFAATLYLLLVAELIRVMDRPEDWLHVCGLSIVTGLLWFCREESGALLLVLFAVIALALVMRRRHIPVKQYALALIGAPLLASALLAALLISADGLRYGVWSTSDIDMPKRAYAALQSIAVESPGGGAPVGGEAQPMRRFISSAVERAGPALLRKTRTTLPSTVRRSRAW